MTLKIYNTLTRQKEEFKTLEPGKVKMYVCGVTVYDYCHLGHARCYISFDVIYRHLLARGYDVYYARNFTDIDDKIIKRSNEIDVDYKELTAKFIKAYHEDMKSLGVKDVTKEPKATEHIQEMIELIEGLEKKGLAYKAGDDVYFSVRKFEEYGKLSGKNVDELEAGARIDVFDEKQDPLDFTLWKAAKPDEPKWESPWGEGRPGWHLECSAMSMKYLGETFDIHGGGRDLTFPHHENEIAQSEGCTGKKFAKYWLHNGFVNIDAEKMSKSLHNFRTIRDVLEVYPPEAIRSFVLSAHYRSPLDYTEQNMNNAVASLERFYTAKKRVEEFLKASAPNTAESADVASKLSDFVERVNVAMDDDFNTSVAVGHVFDLVRDVNKALDEDSLSQNQAERFLENIQKVSETLGVFGLPADEFFTQVKERALSDGDVKADEIEKLIAERAQARKDKNFARSDEIRDELAAKGITLKDSPDGKTTWHVG
jgi:cysteinyl-tRNA synthetase